MFIKNGRKSLILGMFLLIFTLGIKHEGYVWAKPTPKNTKVASPQPSLAPAQDNSSIENGQNLGLMKLAILLVGACHYLIVLAVFFKSRKQGNNARKRKAIIYSIIYFFVGFMNFVALVNRPQEELNLSTILYVYLFLCPIVALIFTFIVNYVISFASGIKNNILQTMPAETQSPSKTEEPDFPDHLKDELKVICTDTDEGFAMQLWQDIKRRGEDSNQALALITLNCQHESIAKNAWAILKSREVLLEGDIADVAMNCEIFDIANEAWEMYRNAWISHIKQEEGHNLSLASIATQAELAKIAILAYQTLYNQNDLNVAEIGYVAAHSKIPEMSEAAWTKMKTMGKTPARVLAVIAANSQSVNVAESAWEMMKNLRSYTKDDLVIIVRLSANEGIACEAWNMLKNAGDIGDDIVDISMDSRIEIIKQEACEILMANDAAMREKRLSQ